jgi:CubicO group peptidase (beta-lactamase class C family)
MHNNNLNAVMCGFPPAPDNAVHASNWFELPYLRWSLMNRSRMVRTVPVWRGEGPVTTLGRGQESIGTHPVTGLDGNIVSLEALLPLLEIDACIVLHKGVIVYENYFHGMQAHTQHGSASISKSYLGILAGILAHEGQLDLNRQADHYVTEMRGTAMGDATLQQLLDMQVGIVRPSMQGRAEGLGPQDGGVFEIIGLMEPGPTSPRNFYEFILRKERTGEHGQSFYYDNGPPEALAWAIKRVCDSPLSELVSKYLFAPLGTERDGAYSIDNTGAEFAAGGLQLTLRDLARFGEALRCDGFWNGKQIIPASYIHEVRRGGNRKLFGQSRFAMAMPGGSYHNSFYVMHDEVEGYMASGRYGQRLYISPRAELVIAHFASAPGPSPHPFEGPYVRMHRELAEQFLR